MRFDSPQHPVRSVDIGPSPSPPSAPKPDPRVTERVVAAQKESGVPGAPGTLGSQVASEASRARRAVEIVLKILKRLSENPETHRLTAQAERLLSEIDLWPDSLPTPEIRDRAMRATVSIHLATLRAAAQAAGK